MRIYVLRHGIAEDAPPGGSDSDRALTLEGRRKLRGVLEHARRAGVVPDIILTSPLKRAVETADLECAGAVEFARTRVGENPGTEGRSDSTRRT